MPRGFPIDSYMTNLFGPGHQAPPWETWASDMRCNPIAAIRIMANIDEWEQDHHRTCPPGLIIAWARVQGLDPDPEMVQKALQERKEWRGHRALPEPGPQAYEVEISIVPPMGGSVSPPGGVFDEGAIVAFTATPAGGFKFDRWAGDASGTDNPITVTVDSDKNITARFKHI